MTIAFEITNKHTLSHNDTIDQQTIFVVVDGTTTKLLPGEKGIFYVWGLRSFSVFKNRRKIAYTTPSGRRNNDTIIPAQPA